MFSASCWVPRGYASEFPRQYDLDDAEMERISRLAQLQLDDANDDLQEAQREQINYNGDSKEVTLTKDLLLEKDRADIEIDEDLKEYHFEDFDDEEDKNDLIFNNLSKNIDDINMNDDSENDGDNIQEDNTKENDDDDSPVLTSEQLKEEEEEERKELQIYPNDNLVVAGRTEDELSYLEVYVYDDGAGNPNPNDNDDNDDNNSDDHLEKGMIRESSLYVHHDFMIPAFPLCIEWLDFSKNDSNNFVAIGTFDPQIEIWNLDSVNSQFPDLILGQPITTNNNNNKSSRRSKKNKRNKKKIKYPLEYHTGAILSLSHNKFDKSILASTSADHMVKVWDLNAEKATRSVILHNNKTVSSSQWSSDSSINSSTILLTGGYDSSICVSDLRVSDESTMSKRWSVNNSEEVENVKWSNDNLLYAGTDNGSLYCFDPRVEGKPLWTLQAHDSGISSLQVNPFINNMIITSAINEKAVKLWKVENNIPSLVSSKNMDIGNILSTSFTPDLEVAGNLAVGGVTGSLKVWDIFSTKSARKAFEESLIQLQKKAFLVAKQNNKSSRIAKKYWDTYPEVILQGE
ncbi:rRNA-processing protein PWP1 [Ascoidea rubescens DSM 1968]|uniref:WD40 repeat-like protein n=1 Tax=Ascoidea rubescens DSM 1968 TaxID=1344418 RepID=A0A1D2VQ01_9ASCO|nr:WD40 repeat-like protein [Ascoidea rubescens DSM 1968]ODV63676.1 WD40 repeat-like protein [Ascoidea rubescens DSM 1968]